MHPSIRPFACALAVALAGAGVPLEAEAHGRHGGYRSAPGAGWHAGARGWAPGHFHHGPRRGWSAGSVAIGVGVGLGLGLGAGTYLYPAYPYPRHGYYVYPGVVYATPPPVLQSHAIPVEPVAPSPPDPVIYPNQQQSPAQLETDRRECNRWALSQPHAVSDAGVFHRATTACMEGRGYTVR